ncbi:MAG: hypothetical protein R2748_05045 [Bryobacterales bacterium]
MPQAADRLNHMLFVLKEDPDSLWEEMNRLWIDSLLEFDGMPEEHVLDLLGASVRRRDPAALASDIERTLRFLDGRIDNPRVTVVWH